MGLKWYIFILALWPAWAGFAQKAPAAGQAGLPKADSNFFISRIGNMYGLGDTSGWYANSPKGDTIYHLGNFYFAVRNNANRYTVYNQAFKALFTRLASIQQFGMHLVLKDSLGCKLFSTKNNGVTEYFDSVQVHGDYAWLYKNKKQGILRSNWLLEQRIPPVYDRVGSYHDGILLIKNGKLGWKGEVDIPVAFDHIYKERPDVMAAKNKNGTVYYSLRTSQKLMVEPVDSIVFYDKLYKRVRGKQQSVFYLSNNKLLDETNGYQLHPYSFDSFSGSDPYCIVTKDSACALFKNGRILTGFDYDNFLREEAIHPPFFRVVNKNKVGVINETGDCQLKSLYTDIVDKKNDYYIVRIGQALGLRLKGDSVILPANYKAITFFNEHYVTISTDGVLFGLYDIINRREVTALHYQSFESDSLFILARKGQHYDAYFKEELKFSALLDAEFNATTVKGYKDGKVLMGYMRNGSWEEYTYEIPSYKVVSSTLNPYSLRAFIFTDKDYMYDYASGKWGQYNFNTQQWVHAPLAHCGDYSGGNWIMGFGNDTSFSWKGIDFYSAKMASPMQTAWDKGSRYPWIDISVYNYSSRSLPNTWLSISPICYTQPGKGECFDNFKPVEVNAVFSSNRYKSVLVEGGRTDISSQGEISLSDYLGKLSSNGTVHPANLQDYEKLLDPCAFIKISGASEHVLQTRADSRAGISPLAAYEWLDKQQINPLVCRLGNLYGALSDSGTYILKPEYESIEPLQVGTASWLKVGVRSQRYKVYDPKTNQFSTLLAPMLESRGELMLLQLDNGKKAVLNVALDTLIVCNGTVALLGDKDFSVKDSLKITAYRNRSVLFSHKAEVIEKINDGHFLVRNFNSNFIMNAAGDTIFKSPKAVKYVALGSQYLIEDGANNSLFSKDDKLLYRFQGERYMVNARQELVIKGDDHVTIFKKDQETKIRITGKFEKAAANYLVLGDAKYKQVFLYDGTLLLKKAKQVKVINGDYLAYQESGKYFLFNVLSAEKTKIKSMQVNLTKEGIDYEDAKENIQSLVVKQADTLLISERNGRVGLLSGEKNILPYKYFQIIKLSDIYLLQDHSEYKIYNPAGHVFVSTEAFENISCYKNYLMLVKKGKFFYMDANGKMVRSR